MKRSEVETIERYLRELYIDSCAPSPAPAGHILGGQPASGKSLLISSLMTENPNSVIINGDDLRRFHPDFHTYNTTNDRGAADLTQSFANSLVQYLQETCLQTKRSFIIEGTMRNPDVPLATVKKLLENKFTATAHVLAVPFEVSLMRSYLRYAEGVRLTGNGRFANVDIQKQAFKALPAAADKLYKVTDILMVYTDGEKRAFNSHSSAPSPWIVQAQNHLTPQIIKDTACQWAQIYCDLGGEDQFPKTQIKLLMNSAYLKKEEVYEISETIKKSTGVSL